MTRRSIDSTRAVRARHVKSRNGCLTCKIRRIRCDETLPFCGNCQSTGRRCEGPRQDKFIFVVNGRQPASRQRSPQSSVSPESTPLPTWTPTLLIDHAPDERRSFDFFVSRSAPLFAAGALNSTFWRKLVPQVCHSNAVVWDAAIAIAALMEHPIARNHVVYRHGTERVIKPQQFQALRWYTRAVSSAKRRVADPNATALALLTSILFSCIEVQQGNPRNALTLIQRGANLFANYLDFAPKEKSPGCQFLDEIVVPFFSQQALSLAMFGLPLLLKAAEASETAPSTIVHLRDGGELSPNDLKLQLYQVIFHAHELIRGAALIIEDVHEVEAFKPRQISVMAELQQWRVRFDATMAKDASLHRGYAPHYLLLHYQATYIRLSVCLSPDETTTDWYKDQFQDIVSHAESLTSIRSELGAGSDLAEFEAEAISPLYFTATKCRDPDVRRRALSLIEQLPKGNTIWATFPVIQILKRLIAFEEGNPAEGRAVHKLPQEEDRVHHVQVVMLPDTANIAARFVSFVKGDRGQREMKEHVVPLENECTMASTFSHCTAPRTSTNGHLPGQPTSRRLAASTDFFEKASPTHRLSPGPLIASIG